MGLIINPRGIGGSGKTELVRRILQDYRWRDGGLIGQLYHPARDKPLGYRLRHPRSGRPLLVIGHYERTSGGCDTIPLSHGGLKEALRLAGLWASQGHDVLLEGSALSCEVEQSTRLAREHTMQIVHLATPPALSARYLVRRRGLAAARVPVLATLAQAQHAGIEAACDILRPIAVVEVLSFDQSYHRVRSLLGL